MVSKSAQTLILQLRRQGINDEDLLNVITKVPREHFIDEALAHKAYENTALPIGLGQTISQPYIVARMTELLQLTPQSRVLEIGTGSGYQTAILAHLAKHVYSVERIKALQWQAKRRLKQLDLHNISTRHSDGWLGWPNHSPFDAIIVTAVVSTIPDALLEQLAEGGILVLPVLDGEGQMLKAVYKRDNKYVITEIESVWFVPLLKGELI